MIEFRPQKPIREFRYKIVFTDVTGADIEVVIASEDEASVENALQILGDYIDSHNAISHIRVIVGDKKDVRIGTEPIPGIQTIEDIRKP